jgi:hypothetical protein
MKLFSALIMFFILPAAFADDEKPKRLVPNPDLVAAMPKSSFCHNPILHGNFEAEYKRPPRHPLKPLPPLPDPNSLTKEALATLLNKIGHAANYRRVAYGSSNGNFEMQVRAEWAKQDHQADVNEYNEQLTEVQGRIARLCFEAGLNENRAFFEQGVPENITLEWIEEYIRVHGKIFDPLT